MWDMLGYNYMSSKVKSKHQDKFFDFLSTNANFELLLGILTEMFEYDGVPDTVRPYYSLLFGALDGHYCFLNHNSEYYLLPVTFEGGANANGEYVKGIARFLGDLNGELNVEVIDGINAVFGYFTKDRCPCFDLLYYTELLNEIDKSLRLNTIFSRNKTIPLVKNSKDAMKVDSAINDIEIGKTKSIQLDSAIDDYFTDTMKPSVQQLELTKPEMMKFLPELNKCYDDILSRFLCKYGHSTNYAGKMAQMTEKELQGYDTYSRIMPNKMLSAQKDFWDKVNKHFGLNVTVRFSPAFRQLEDNP